MVAHEHINLTRRKMIRVLGWLVLIPFIGLWDSMVKRNQARGASAMSKILITDIPQGKSFLKDYWITRNSDTIKVYSTKCPHLGCSIRPTADGQLICPCHGSAFDQENGTIIKGPAGKDLEMLDYVIEDDHLTIYLK